MSWAVRNSFRTYLKMPKSKASQSNVDEKSKLKIDKEKGAVYSGTNNEIFLKIHAKPGSKETTIADISSDHIEIQISAPPVDGDANKKLIHYLAEGLGLKKADLDLIKGSKSRDKIVKISTPNYTVEDITARLKAFRTR